METHGRERRHKYFTVANYRKLVAHEELDKNSAGYADIDLENVGGFLPVSAERFYDTDDALIRYTDAFNDNNKSPTRKPKRPPKNPILPDGKAKRGRPRKNPTNDEQNPLTEPVRKGKRRRGDMGDTDTHAFPTEIIEDPVKKRPRFAKPPELEEQTCKPSGFCFPPPLSNPLRRLPFSAPKRGKGRRLKLKDPNNVSKVPKDSVPTLKKCEGPGEVDKVSQVLENSGMQNQLSTFGDSSTGRTRTRGRGRHGSEPPLPTPILDNIASLVPVPQAGDMPAPSEGSVETNPAVENIQDTAKSAPSHIETLDLDPSIVSSSSWICRSNFECHRSTQGFMKTKSQILQQKTLLGPLHALQHQLLVPAE